MEAGRIDGKNEYVWQANAKSRRVTVILSKAKHLCDLSHCHTERERETKRLLENIKIRMMATVSACTKF